MEEKNKFSYESINITEEIIEKSTEVLNLFPNINSEEGIKVLFDSLVFCLNFAGENYIEPSKHSDIVRMVANNLFPLRKKPKSAEKKNKSKIILDKKIITMRV